MQEANDVTCGKGNSLVQGVVDGDALARVAAAMADTSIDAVYGDLVYVRKDDPFRVLRTWNAGGFVPEKLNRGWMPPHPTFYARRSIYERLGNFDTSFRIAADQNHMSTGRSLKPP